MPARRVSGMETCPECGCDRVVTTRRDGVLIGECDLCGALVGDDTAIAKLQTGNLARARGVDPLLWVLVEQLRSLPGLEVVSSGAGALSTHSLPHVRMVLTGNRGMLALENLVKSLALGRGARQLAWGVDVDFDRGLVFTLQPRVHGAVDARMLAAAHEDLEQLGRELQRNRRLSWWRQ